MQKKEVLTNRLKTLSFHKENDHCFQYIILDVNYLLFKSLIKTCKKYSKYTFLKSVCVSKGSSIYGADKIQSIFKPMELYYHRK